MRLFWPGLIDQFSLEKGAAMGHSSMLCRDWRTAATVGVAKNRTGRHLCAVVLDDDITR
jgi:hypothetical protein